MNKKLTIAALALSTAIVAPASAAPIFPVAATASTSYTGYEAGYAIDGSATTDWASASEGVGSSILFDLGGGFVLNTANLNDRTTSGGGNGGYVGGLSDFTTLFRLTYYGVGNVVLGTQDFSRTAPTSPTGASDFASSFSTANYGKVSAVRYTVRAANGVNPGLSGASFTGSVPEPTTWGMMLLGFGMMGVGLRYRQRKTAVTFG